MLQIRINGHRLDLNPQQTIVLERYNPIFDFDVVRGSKVLDFMVPFSTVNDRIFGYARLPQVRFTNEVFFCEKYEGSELLERGYVYLLGVSETGYSISYSQNLGEIFGDYQRTPLNQIDLGEESIPEEFTASANHLTDAYCLPVISNPAFYGTTLPPDFAGTINTYETGSYLANTPKVPMLFLRWVFKQIEILCNFKIKGQFVDDPVMQRLILVNTFSLDSATVINYSNHLPELTIPDLLKELRKLFNLALFFDVRNRILTIQYVDNLIQQEPILDWSRKFAPVATRAPESARRLELDWEVDSNDGRMKVRPEDFQLYQSAGDSALFAIKSKFSTLDPDPISGRPTMEQPGISPINNQMNNKFAPRLLFWKGVIEGEPTAGNAEGEYRLAWHGSSNLATTFWSEYESFRARTDRRLLYGDLTSSDVARIDLHRTAGEPMKVYIQGRNYLIGAQRIGLPLRGLSEVELWGV
ncbi:hypothetical protein [Arundinibacter roseus]|uniref:Uncharacterized protein n=1 Tax=Arundinibacter roseus TaxID=2070510 RepID=A0A4R4K707_9BACT|nr:hypothetical protein [Arundinibacter roseus]TDB63317.1 hypothetical protein EZE20_16215 [Arundinibacter roseus]